MQRRMGKTGLACVVCALALPALAAADANVSLSSGTFTVDVVGISGGDGGHGIVAEPYQDSGRNGFRARQDQGGRPRYTDSGANCDTNFLVNDVVCSGSRSSIEIGGGDSSDTIVVSGSTGGIEAGLPRNQTFAIGAATRTIAVLDLGGGGGGFAGQICLNGAAPALTAVVDGGDAADFVLALDPQGVCGEGQHQRSSFLPRLEAEGGSGNDAMAGASQNDVLEGETGNDILLGSGGNDSLVGGSGNDTLNGGGGDDLLDPGRDSNVIIGGPGEDTVTYETLSAVQVTLDGQANDGFNPTGRDNVDATVENIVGGDGPDSITVFSGEHELDGNAGDDGLVGGAGDDVLRGDEGGDVLRGNDGVDAYLAGSEGDLIFARDGVRDGLIRCGAGTDGATLDLLDVLLTGNSCEGVSVSAVDDGLPSHGVGRVQVAATSARVRILCPPQARVACRGALTVRTANGRRVLARARYDIPVRRTETVNVQLAARPGAWLLVQTREQGTSKKGPRSSSWLLRVATG